MGKLLNKQGLEHYANKMVLAENRKVGSKSLPAALNDIDVKLDEMKTQFDKEYGSALDMKLENNKNIFSVGTGSGVDKRTEVENSFTDVELKGNSLVNMKLNKGSTCRISSSDNADNKYHVTTHSDPRKLVAEIVESAANLKLDWIYSPLGDFNKSLLKTNTTYTIFLDNKYDYLYNIGLMEGNTSNAHHKSSQKISSNIYKVTTKDSFDGLNINNIIIYGYIDRNYKGKVNIEVLAMVEGDWTNKPISEYFEELKSIGEAEGNEIEVSSTSKNLFNLSNMKNIKNWQCNIIEKNINGIKLQMTGSDGVGYCGLSSIKVKPNTRYIIKSMCDATVGKQSIIIFNGKDFNLRTMQFDFNRIGNVIVGGFTTPSNVNELSFYIYPSQQYPENINKNIVTFSNIQLEENSEATTYDLPKLDKKQISLNAPLRGLPNGIKDTIEKVNGEWKIIRRCGEVIFNGGENWNSSLPGTTNARNRYDVFNSLSKKNFNHPLCDKFKSFLTGSATDVDIDFVTQLAAGGFAFFVNSTTYPNIESFKEWLKSNPTKVIYELETPVIEDIDPVTLQCWKNGTISIDSVIPVESTHTVALNKPAQIKRNIEELTSLRNKVKTLEEQYDKIALEQAYQFELLNQDIKLDFNI